MTAPTSICRNCGTAVVFAPYFLDGREPNPPRWFHSPGTFTCAVNDRPEGEPWPVAAPLKES